MTTNGVNNVDDADMTECDGEKVVTMMDVLQEQQEFEEDANAVLGASDDKECTYSKGYIKRQAIYVCLTCCSGAKDDPSQRAGVCLACSLNCHENHELIELYTKRNFRCDCGNPKFNSHPCQFTSNKVDLNEDNHYNQNFSGIYCICNRPYPDPEATVEEEMIQCIICEDWLHSNHLEAVVPANDLYAEMICKACMDKNDFLHDYSELAVNYEVDVDVTPVNGINNSINIDVDSTHLVNGEMNTTNVANFDIEKNKEETEIKSSCSTSDNNKTESPEKVQLEDTNIAVSKNNDNAESTDNSTEDSEQNDKLQKPESQDAHGAKEIVNNEVQADLGTSESTTSQMATQEEKLHDGFEELPKPISEPNESIVEATKEVFNPTENLIEQENTNKISYDSDSKENTPAVSEEKNEEMTVTPSEIMDNASKVTENNDMDTLPRPTDCEVDSLEAATKELSELMEDEGKTNQTNNYVEVKPSEEQAEQTSTTDSTANENGLKDEDMNGDKKFLENDNTLNNTEKDQKRKIDDKTNEVAIKKPKLDKSDNCLRPRGVKRTIKGAAFWPSNLRQKLCTCNDCLSMYRDLNVLFLTDPDDTVTAYETLGKERIDGGPTTQYEKGLEALSSLDRVQQINALTEYNRMRDKLLDFLKSFKDRKEIVKEEDIKAFFAGMKPRREPDGVYFCR